MKTRHSILAIVLSTICLAEEATPPAIDMEARKASVANLEAQVQQREARLAEVGTEIVALDTRIEKRVAELVAMLANMRDSQDSRYKVSKMKREAIEQLRNGIQLYARKRAEMAEKVRRGDDSALGDLDKIDERNLTRIQQIVELTKSFPTHRDVEKYEESSGDSYWRGYYHENTRISDEWRQARRDETQANVQRDATSKAIREGIERTESRRAALVNQLQQSTLTEDARKLAIHEVGQCDAIIDRLNSQLQDVVSNEQTGGGRQPSLDEAIDIDHLLDDARKDLRDDVSRLFRLYDVFTAERGKIHSLKENLEARKAWLKEHDKEEQ
jgi:hypothetical protein